MRVLLINQAFYPDVAATAQHAHDLARYLVEHGHEVTAIASRSVYGAKGAAFPPHEHVDGIEIIRVGSSFFGKSSIAARLIDSGLFHLPAVWRAITMKRHDVVVCLTTPPFVAGVGWITRLIRGTPFVYWALDLYPDLPIACGVVRQNSMLARFLESVNRFFMRRANRVVVIGRCMEARILQKGVPAANIERINVWSDQDEVHPVARDANNYRREWGVGDRLLVMYSGNFGIGHDVETIADAVARLGSAPDIMFAFVGGGKRKSQLIEALRARGLTNFINAPYQPRERLDELLSAGDVHLASLRDGVEGIMVPSKLFGVLAAARPVIFIGSANSEVAHVIREDQCGAVVSCGDGEGLSRAILAYASDRQRIEIEGQNGRRALVERWSARHALSRWLAVLENVAGARANASKTS
jgi:colanic acid biosynthesis glycosyl transferase WcaI